jgi:TPR repeat protein
MATSLRRAARAVALAVVALAGCAGTDSALRRCDAGSGAACLEAARALPARLASDRARAVALRAKACERGEHGECLGAGLAYARGVDVTLDLERAGTLLERGCQGADFDACNYAGALLVPLPGFLGDGVRALRLFEFACHHGSAAGCYNAARRYEHGDVEGADPRRAAQFLGRAAELAGEACGDRARSGIDCYVLGFMAAHGRAVPKDPVRSGNAYRKACAAREPFGCAKWAAAIERGELAPPEPAGDSVEEDDATRAGRAPDAIRAWACDAGAWDACELLAERVRAGGRAFGRDVESWLAAACAHGSGRACTRLVENSRNDPARAAAFLRAGCDARDAASCAGLAERYLEGRGVPQSARRAAALLERLCSAGDPNACRSASRIVASGEGDLTASAEGAFALLERACRFGDAAACEETLRGVRASTR